MVAAACLAEALEGEIARQNLVRAVILAEQLNRPQDEVRRLQELALVQMACQYRNALATYRLAGDWGFSSEELRSLLMKAVAEHERRCGQIHCDKCYDPATGNYLTLRQWLERFLRMRGKGG